MDEHGATDAFVSVKFHGQVRARPGARGRARGRVTLTLTLTLT